MISQSSFPVLIFRSKGLYRNPKLNGNGMEGFIPAQKDDDEDHKDDDDT